MNREKLLKNKYLKLFSIVYKSLPKNIKQLLYTFLRTKVFQDLKVLPEDRILRIKISKRKSFSMKHFGGGIEHEIFTHGLFKTWESDVGWLWMELVAESDIIFDIGANKGIYSLVAGGISPKSKIYSFEPSINSFNKLIFNSKLNSFNITCEQLAVSNVGEIQTFYDIPNENQTTASLSPEKMKNWKGYSGEILEYKVKSIRLSDYIEAENIQSIDLIKIDIEMHEPEAIEGLGKYLLEFKPIIIFEMLNEQVASKIGLLVDLNEFLLFHFEKGGRIKQLCEVKIPKYSIENMEWNYLLIHKSKKESVFKKTSLPEKIY